MPALIRNHGHHFPSDFELALDNILAAANSTTKKRDPDLKFSTVTISLHAAECGLPNEALAMLVDIVTRPNSLDQSSQNALIKTLYPAERVSSEVLCTVIGSLGHGMHKVSVSAQVLLLQWVIMVSEFLEQPMFLQKFYGVLFNLLDVTSLRADLCHLLSKLTRRRHVKPFRLQMLQRLLQTVGEESALLKFANVYERYTPGTLDLANSKRQHGDFTSPNSGWSDHLDRIQRKVDSSAIRTAGHTEDFVHELERSSTSEVELSDLRDQKISRQFALGAVERSELDINALLSPVFERELERAREGRGTSKAFKDILEGVLAYMRFTKVLPKSAISFFEEFLPKWEGQLYQETILSLLSYLPPEPFDELKPKIFTPLEEALLSSTKPDPSTQTTILTFYTTLLAHWTASLLSSPPPTPRQTTTLTSLHTHTTLLIHTLLTTNPTPSTTLSILTYYYLTLPLLLPPLLLPLSPPPSLQTTTLLFTAPTLSTLSHTSSLLAAYKITFEAHSATSTTPPRPPEHITQLNGMLIDTCNLLFRSRAFNSTDPHALGCLMPTPVIAKLADYTASLSPPQALMALFSLSHNPALCALSIAAFREIEEAAVEEGREVGARHAGPITQKSLGALAREGGIRIDWKEYRVAVLKWLEGIGVGGLKGLGGATMKGLLGGGSEGTREAVSAA